MTAAARIILAGGLDQIGTSLPSALTLAAVILGAVLLALRWHLGRRSRITHLVFLPPAEHGEPVIDDALPMFFERRTQPAPWPDGDTVIDNGLTDELNEMLKGDGRDD